MIKTMLWDWNGVVIADSRACYEAYVNVVRYLGGRKFSLEDFRRTFTIPSIEFYVRQGCRREDIESRSQEVGELFYSFYEPRAGRCRTRSGLRQTLVFLKNFGITTAILSNQVERVIKAHLERLKLTRLFSAVLASSAKDSATFGQSKLERARRYLDQNKLKSGETLIIGDSPEEVRVGKRLGFVTVAITGGHCSASRLVAGAPDFLINKVSQLISVIKQQA